MEMVAAHLERAVADPSDTEARSDSAKKKGTTLGDIGRPIPDDNIGARHVSTAHVLPGWYEAPGIGNALPIG